jgi:uncharacterized protein
MSDPASSISEDSLFACGSLGADFFYLSSDGQFVLLAIEPVEMNVDVQLLTGLLQQSNFRNYQISEKALQDAANNFNELKNGSSSAEGVSSHSVMIVARRLDGQLSVLLSKDGMSATATVTAPYAGKRISVPQVRATLNAEGITHGISTQAISELLVQVDALAPGAELTAVVARGQEAINGADSRFEKLVETLRERVLRPQVQDARQDRVDLRDLGTMVTVAVGDAVMCRHAPEPGIPGFKVTGESLPAKPGEEVAWNVGTGTQVSLDDPELLIAIQEGLPQEIEHGMQVDEVLTIRDVDAKFGHVTFSGSVMISGNVCEGMHVKAGGSVTIAGLVESAEIVAGGDVLVEKGIIGHPLHEHGYYSCKIRCGGSVAARFGQYADITAAGDVMIGSQLLHCRVETPGSLTVADASRSKGSLLGGEIIVGQQVLAVTLGGMADTSTHIFIQGCYPELLVRRKALRGAIEHSEMTIKQLEDADAKVHQLPIGNKRNLLSQKITATRSHVVAQLACERAEWDQINAERDAFLSQARVLCARQLYAGVKVEIAGFKLTSERDYPTCQVIYNDGQLVVEPVLAIPDATPPNKKN